MRIALISDIHGNLPALLAVLDDIARRGADLVANLGDIVSGPLWPAETAEHLMALGLPTVAGNHERQVLDARPERHGPSDAWAATRLAAHHRAWLAGLPAQAWLTPQVYACHGCPGSDLHYWLETVTADYGIDGSHGLRAATEDEARERAQGSDALGAAVAVCGHSHVPRILRLSGGTLLVNPGSVGLPAYLDDHPLPHRVQTGSPHARYATVQWDGRDWQAQLHAVGYDHASAAQRAQAHGRPDWAHALATGLALEPSGAGGAAQALHNRAS